MYDVLARSAKGTRNGMRNWIPVQPRKVQRNKKVATKIREACEKTLFKMLYLFGLRRRHIYVMYSVELWVA